MAISEQIKGVGDVLPAPFAESMDELFEKPRDDVEAILSNTGADVTYDLTAIDGSNYGRGTIRFVFLQSVGDMVLAGFIYIPYSDKVTTAYDDLKKHGVQIMPLDQLFSRWVITAERSTFDGGVH